MVLLIQWNARSLVANGQELKSFIDEVVQKPDVICIQEAWLRPKLDFCDTGVCVYVSVEIEMKEVGEDVLHLLNWGSHIGSWDWERSWNMWWWRCG